MNPPPNFKLPENLECFNPRMNEESVLNENQKPSNRSNVSTTTYNKIPVSRSDERPYANVLLFDKAFRGLLDSGASVTVKRWCPVVEEHLSDLRPSSRALTAANSGTLDVLGEMVIPITYGNKKVSMLVVIVDQLAQELILGVDFWRLVGIQIEVMAIKPGSGPVITTEIELDDQSKQECQDAVGKFLITTKDFLGRTHLLKHRIELQEGAKPFLIRSHQYAPALREKMIEELEDMLRRKVICPSKSPVASPIVPVVKSDGSVRLCIDSRTLNSLTKRDQFPVPNIQHLFARMPKAKYLSTIDLSKAFWQVPLCDEPIPGQFANSQELTAFVLPGRGLFQFTVMPFGLTNSPATQCRLMYLVLGHDLEPWTFVYMDDILLLSETIPQMIELIRKVATRLTTAGLSINFEKSKFFASSVKYLGYIISEGGMRLDPQRLEAMTSYSRPTNTKSVRRFLGMTGYYRRLIQDYSGMAAALTDLLKKSVTKFLWTEEAEDSFQKLRNAMMTAPVIANPDFDKDFHIQCDASDVSGAAALGQIHESGEVVIAYYSHKWTGPESRWGATEREAATVLYAIRHFNSYLWGRPILVITDAQALTHIRTIRTGGSSRLSRWVLELSQYDLTIKHRAGKLSVVPDALSRAVDAVNLLVIERPSTPDLWYLQMVAKIRENPDRYPDFRLVGDELFKFEMAQNDLGCLNYRYKRYVPENHRLEVIEDVHKRLCHLGWEKSYGVLRANYFWPGMVSAVEHAIRSCPICKASKPTIRHTRVPMGTPRMANECFQRIAIDHWGPATLSRKGNAHLLIVVDVFSKFVLLHPCRDTSSLLVTRFLEEHVFAIFGSPQTLISDNHRPLVGRNMVELLNKYGIEHWTLPFYHSQANPAERYLRTVGAAIRAQVAEHAADHRSWDEDVPLIQWAMNTTENSSTKMSPFLLNFGREPVFAGPDFHLIGSHSRRDQIARAQLLERFQQIRNKAKENLQKAQESYRNQYDKNTSPTSFLVGERVWRRNRELSNAGRRFSQKLAPRYVPSFIIRSLGRDTYLIRDDRERGVVSKAHANDLLKDS